MKYLVIDKSTEYKQMFELFAMPTIYKKLGKQLTKIINDNKALNFYTLDDKNDIMFEYSFRKPYELSEKTVTRLLKKLKELGYDLCVNYVPGYYSVKYIVKGKFV
jgi:hypothetical protein